MDKKQKDTNARSDAKIIGGKVLYSTSRLCYFLGISRKTLRGWVTKGCPAHARGWYDLEAILEWRGYIGNSRPVTENELETASLQEQKMAADVRYKQAQAELTEYKNAINAGQYLERELVESELSRFFVILKTSLRSLPRRIGTRLASQIDPAEARHIETEVSKTIDGALNQFADKIEVGNGK